MRIIRIQVLTDMAMFKAFDELLPTPWSVSFDILPLPHVVPSMDMMFHEPQQMEVPSTPQSNELHQVTPTHTEDYFSQSDGTGSVLDKHAYTTTIPYQAMSDVMDGNLNDIATSFATHMSSAVDGGLGDSGDNPNSSASGTSLPPTTDHRRGMRKTLEKKPSVECICPQKLHFNPFES